MNPLTLTQARELLKPRFTEADAERCAAAWGANCGPGAIAAVCGLTLDELRPHLGDFEAKRYTNPTLMLDTLKRIGVLSGFDRRTYRCDPPGVWPTFGLARIQWEGPWTAPGVPIAARYRHTHWIGSASIEGDQHVVFDINCINVGGWVSRSLWQSLLVPWLLEACEPRANGKWHIAHSIEIARRPRA